MRDGAWPRPAEAAHVTSLKIGLWDRSGSCRAINLAGNEFQPGRVKLNRALAHDMREDRILIPSRGE